MKKNIVFTESENSKIISGWNHSHFSQEFDLYKPKYTLEFETKNLAYSQAISCNPLEGCKYLNT